MQVQWWSFLVAVGLFGVLLGSCSSSVNSQAKEKKPVDARDKTSAAKGKAKKQSSLPPPSTTKENSKPLAKKKLSQGNQASHSSKPATRPAAASSPAHRALERAKSYIENGKLTLATYYLTCAVAHDPTNMEAVREYHNVVVRIARNDFEQDRPSSAIEKLHALSQFLRQHTAHVLPDQIEELLKLAERVDQQIAKWDRESSAPVVPPSQEQAEQKLAELEQQASKGLTRIEELSKRLEEARSLREEIQLHFSDSNLVGGIEEVIRRLEANQLFLSRKEAFETLLSAFEELCQYSFGEQVTKTDQARLVRAAYTLQHCEGIVRDWMALRHRLPSGLQAQVDHAAVCLNEAAEQLQKKRSELAWREFLNASPRRQRRDRRNYHAQRRTAKTVEEYLQEIRRWKPPANATPDGVCQEQIERIQAVMQEAGNVAGRLEYPEYKEKLRELLKELTDKLRLATETQRTRYSMWALERIEKCYSRYLEAKGIDDDEPMIASALIEELGPINVTLLRSEIYRLYNEVFNTALSELGLGNNEPDENDTKIYVLKSISFIRNTKEETKRKVHLLSDF